VAATGGHDKLPEVLDRLVTGPGVTQPGLTARALFDDGQYLGYRVTVGGRSFDVIGAASRTPPRTGPFSDVSIKVRELALPRDAPIESGNFDGGYAVSVTQARYYRAWVAGGELPHAAGHADYVARSAAGHNEQAGHTEQAGHNEQAGHIEQLVQSM